MNTRLSLALVLSAALAVPFVTAGCEESHSESTHENLLGGTTHEETTVRKNPVTGDVTVDKQRETTH